MGAAQIRRRNFLAQHRTCFFCGETKADTVDHVPARECFKNGIGPEGFEFPACKLCNHKLSGDEQVVALYIHLFNFDSKNVSIIQLDKLLRGVNNNYAPCLPINLRANQKRRGLKSGHLHTGHYEYISELPMVGFPERGYIALERFARKLTCALYYKHCGKSVPKDFYIMTMTLFASEKRTSPAVEKFIDMLPDYFLSKRINTDIGEQFHYKYGNKDAGNLFAFVSQFSQSIFVIGAVTRTNQNDKIHWKQHNGDLL